MESSSVCNCTICLPRDMITDRIGRHEVLLPINHKNYNFREEKSQVMKQGENLHNNLLPHIIMVIELTGVQFGL